MSRTGVELDFFGMEKKENQNSSSSQFKKFLRHQRSFRDIQGAISKINPEILKSVIASGSPSVPSTPKEDVVIPPTTMPLFSQIPRSAAAENLPDSAPLTIFYNGTVAVFDVPRKKVDTILRLAVEGNSNTMESNHQQLLESLNNGDLPIARRKSLQRFLEKRKDRLTAVCPYSSCQA